MDQPFNLIPIFISLLQAVPVWAVVALGVHFWVKKKEASENTKGLELLEMKKLLQKIDKELTRYNLHEIKGQVDDLIEQSTDHKYKIDALYKMNESASKRKKVEQ